jgi:predicted HD phosphohydrolase
MTVVLFASVDDLLVALAALGRTPSEEAADFTELDHGLQCANELAALAPDDLELQVAGLVHDIGHQFGDDAAHGALGALAVRLLLGERVAALVEGHVPAKRYLVAVSPEYAGALSPVSIQTLAVQGGRLDAAEIEEFRRRPHWRDAVRLRRCDDSAKVPGRSVPGIDQWLPVIEAVARRRE